VYPVEKHSARLLRQEKPLFASAPLGRGIREKGSSLPGIAETSTIELLVSVK
jgi:hypothetical protein